MLIFRPAWDVILARERYLVACSRSYSITVILRHGLSTGGGAFRNILLP
jgi:hypothetical protein